MPTKCKDRDAMQCTDLDPISTMLALDVPNRPSLAPLASITLHAVPRAFDLGITPCAIHVPGILSLSARYTSRVRVANRSVAAVQLVWTSENVPDQVMVWSVDWDEVARVDPGMEVELDVVGRARWPGVLDRTANAALVCAAYARGGIGEDEDGGATPVWTARLPVTAAVGDLAAHPVITVEPAALELDAVPLGEAAVASLTVTNTHANRAIAWHLVASREVGYVLALDPPRGVLPPGATAHVRATLVPLRAGCARGQVQCCVAPWIGTRDTTGDADEDDGKRVAVVALAVPFSAVCDVPALDVGVISAADKDDDEAAIWAAAAGAASVNVPRVFAGAPPITACTIALRNTTLVPAEFRIRVASDLDEDTEITVGAPSGWVPAGVVALVAISVAAARIGARVSADLVVTCPRSTRAMVRLTGARAPAAELVCDAASTGVDFGDLAVLDPAEMIVRLRNPANAPVAFELAVAASNGIHLWDHL
ncbi:hypothetical protein AMAG_19183 [Allomyces macrogynus ATCC 38327]|uniref:Uncharacterized protein n=1 Tax=Allomyces macrogynus (strain ATCC 38327) TaxID=578462 RepID=A0A0L0STB0_ALLM3|nr:hypothetical protein AMAG_19183 [Allomyces macrogynus ATCC 38327]|eukprot:KNE65574.1 hypothetical protein AMAG_19183 [Allomyces macrogynus ATCC 38327]